MKKRVIIGALVTTMLIAALTGCTDSSKQSNVGQSDYDPNEEIAPYLDNLPEIPEADKEFVIQMGYNDCDHMVAAIIGETTGLYEALGLNVVVTKTGQVASAMGAGDMVAGYSGFSSMLKAANKGAPVFMPAGNHLGGSKYFVIREDINSAKEIIGSRITITEDDMYSPYWLSYAEQVGIPKDYTLYQGVDMDDNDAIVAMKAGQLDGFMCCDPFASMAEMEGIGKIIGTEWGGHISEDLESGWGLHCGYFINSDFAKAHPELTTRLVLAHCLSIKYMYQHPYNAGMMFADDFGVDPAVGLRTMYLKLCAEGRTLSWDVDETNIKNYTDYWYSFGIPEEEIPYVKDIPSFLDLSYMEACGIESFESFMEDNKINEKFPKDDPYLTWLEKAESIDGIDHSSTLGKTVEKWNNNQVVTKLDQM
ncbi:ABC transporter substrate-binding subunit SaoX [Dehalobacterium formicoaceticum]|uniref:ABC transporter substrate-binding subunit SaoX n=1 Tax=Dehalobacterium formicoaceticum TaxID=51515 RepID=A0ABT1Y6H9_9FIRM|nr:ABC transporter substrate-binding subunit SaoX [Dehalobacterium formicoaceticum]MCR6546495.1 ABC transporter substrate-binding subunit SaoX [Dehalobacterium formicoaceticum]